MIPISLFEQQPRSKNKHKSYFSIILPVSVTSRHDIGEQEALHSDWRCLNLPSLFLFFYLLSAGDWSWSLGNKQGALCPFSSLACLPDSHGPMIDCSLSAFVLGNCFVLLTVCLRSRPDSRDIAAPFFAYLQNMFKTVSKWITVEYVKVGEGWGGRWNCPICSERGGAWPGSEKIKCTHYKWRWDYTRVCVVCEDWRVLESTKDEDTFRKFLWGHKTIRSRGSWDVYENDQRISCTRN